MSELLNEFIKSFLVTKSRIRGQIEVSPELCHDMSDIDLKNHIQSMMVDKLYQEFSKGSAYAIKEETIEENHRSYMPNKRFSSDILIFDTGKFRDVLDAYVELHPKYKEMKEKAWQYDQLNK